MFIIPITYFYAVDFDSMIIHAEKFTWEEWCAYGMYTYPTCQPMSASDLQANRDAFTDFVDMR